MAAFLLYRTGMVALFSSMYTVKQDLVSPSTPRPLCSDHALVKGLFGS